MSSQKKASKWPNLIAIVMGIPGWIVVGLMFYFRYFPDPTTEPDITRTGPLMTGWFPVIVVVATMTFYMVGWLMVTFRSRRNRRLTDEIAAFSNSNEQLTNDLREAERKHLDVNRDKHSAESERDGLKVKLEAAQREIQSKESRVEQLMQESYEANKRAKSAEQESEAKDKLFQDRENQLGKLLWLKKRMEEQAKDISEHVVVKKSKLCSLRLDRERCVIVALTVKNESLFDVTIDFEKITGCLFFNTVPRHDPVHVLKQHSPSIVNLEPMVQSEIIIKQPLLKTEAEIISEVLQDENARFWLGNLNIPVSVGNVPQSIDIKSLRIGEEVENLYLKDYDNDPIAKIQDGEGLTIPEIRRRIDRLPPAERAKATRAALSLWGESFYQED